MIESALAAAAALENLPLLEQSDLPDAVSRVRIAPATVTLEEFTKIWSIFFQVPYGLSAAYVCSHVVVESDERFATALPVARADVLAGPISGFALSWAGPDSGGPGPVVAGGNAPSRRQGSRPGRHDPDDRRGRHAVRNGVGCGDPGDSGRGPQGRGPSRPGGRRGPRLAPNLRRRSNTIPFALHPSIALPAGAVTHDNADPRTGTIKVDFSPPSRRARR